MFNVQVCLDLDGTRLGYMRVRQSVCYVAYSHASRSEPLDSKLQFSKPEDVAVVAEEFHGMNFYQFTASFCEKLLPV